jgi:hypothetical protein
MHPQTIYDLAKMRIAEDKAYATHQARVREARNARKEAAGASTDESLLDRITTALRKAARPASRPTAGVA